MSERSLKAEIFEQYSGMADLAQQVEVSAKTAFTTASITKLFSATFIMQLIEQGQLFLEDPISKFLPEAMWIWENYRSRHIQTDSLIVLPINRKKL